MNSIRKIAFKPWVSRTIVTVWALWSGMFLCLLTPAVEASHLASSSEQTVMMEAMDAEAMLSHCLEVTDDPEGLTCKSEVNGPLVLPDIVKVAAVHSNLLFLPFESIDPTTEAVAPRNSAPLYFAELFLLFCTFLK